MFGKNAGKYQVKRRNNMKANTYRNEDEKFDEIIDTLEGETNEEIEAEFEIKYGSNDYNLSYC
jgi:hypothetical protein